MKKLITGLLAASTLAVALPAAAQIYYTTDRAERLDSAINVRQDDGSLSSSDARNLRMQLRDLERLDRRYQYDGMSGWQARDLNRRYSELSDEIRDLSGE
jgi:hypothetical protein